MLSVVKFHVVMSHSLVLIYINILFEVIFFYSSSIYIFRNLPYMGYLHTKIFTIKQNEIKIK